MIINDLDGYYIVFDTKNWNTELDTLLTWCEQDVAGITSRRICYCVVTPQMLRRDVISGTSASGAAYQGRVSGSAFIPCPLS